MTFLKNLGKIILSLIGIVILFPAIVIFMPILTVPKQPIQKVKQAEILRPRYRKDVSFEVDGILVRAWLYIKTYPVGHFEIYIGENFEKSVSDQITFFKKHLI